MGENETLDTTARMLRPQIWRGFFRAHGTAVVLIAALIACIFGSIRMPVPTVLAGLGLCVFGIITERGTRADLIVVVPLIIYNVFSLLSALEAYGTPSASFARTQMICVPAYLLMARLSDPERARVRTACGVVAGVLAAVCLIQYLTERPENYAGRLAGSVIGGPNAIGTFFVIGWAALSASDEKRVRFFEPLILSALALTLSMGSFLALGIAVLTFVLLEAKHSDGRSALCMFRNIAARLVIGMSVGVLLYVAVQRTSAVWLPVCVAAYLALAAYMWDRLRQYLERSPKTAWGIVLCGALLAAATIALRPGARATFAERFQMMGDSVPYLFRNPVFGLGPFQWWQQHLAQTGVYYGTTHIHNVFLHVGVELGLIALAAIIVIGIRFFTKPNDPWAKAAGAAFVSQCMIDMVFFVDSITMLSILAAARPKEQGTNIGRAAARAVYAFTAFFFVVVLVTLAEEG